MSASEIERLLIRQDTMHLEKQKRPESPLLDELASVGVVLESIWSTSHIKEIPPEAFRIILKHLTLEYPARTKEGMAQSLARREARDVIWPDLLNIYRNLCDDTGKDRVKDGVAASLHMMARPSDLETLIELVSDPDNGPSRIFFVRNLSRIRKAKALETLVKLRDDPDLSKEIEAVLRGKLKRKQFAPGSKN